MIARLPEDELERLEALRKLDLLDTTAEPEFDGLVQLASALCKTPIALVTLVDQKRQWFKASVGLHLQETSRDVAFCAHAILQQDIFIVPDASLDHRFAENPLVKGDPRIRFYAGVPLETVNGDRLGTLCVVDRVPRQLTTEQKNALAMLAKLVMAQINLRRQKQDLEMAIAERDIVEGELRASQMLFNAFMDHSPFLSFMKDSDGKMVYYNQICADRFGIDRRAWLGRTDTELWPPDVAQSLRAHDLQVLREWRTIVVEEHADPSDGTSPLWRSYKFPFKNSDGHAYLAGFAMDVTQEKEVEERLLLYKEALEAANEKLTRLAVTDSLTGLKNRRALEEELAVQFEIARHQGMPLSLLLLDVDDFKSFNDTFGHAEGDLILQSAADILERSFRVTDMVARYGGEEFAILLPNTSEQDAWDLAVRLCHGIAEAVFHQHRITVSIGTISLHASINSPAALMRLADDALYAAKRGGKNRVASGNEIHRSHRPTSTSRATSFPHRLR